MRHGSLHVLDGTGRHAPVLGHRLRLDRHRQLERLFAQQREHALAAVQHVAVKKRLGEQVVMLVGRTHALVHVLRRQVLVHGRL